MFQNRCKTEDHLIDPDATAQDSAQALLDEAPIQRKPTAPATISRWAAVVERLEGVATSGTKIDLAVLASLLRAELLEEMKRNDELKAQK